MSDSYDEEYFDAEEGDDFIDLASDSTSSSDIQIPQSALDLCNSGHPAFSSDEDNNSSVGYRERLDSADSEASNFPGNFTSTSFENGSHNNIGNSYYSSDDVDSVKFAQGISRNSSESVSGSEKYASGSGSEKYMSGPDEACDTPSLDSTRSKSSNPGDSDASPGKVLEEPPLLSGNSVVDSTQIFKSNDSLANTYYENSVFKMPKPTAAMNVEKPKRSGISFMIQRMFGFATDTSDIKKVTVKAVKKSTVEFEGLNLTQSLTTNAHDGPIWVMKFSNDGAFFASGGKDTRILVWSVGNAPDFQSSKAKKSTTMASVAKDNDNLKGKTSDSKPFQLFLPEPIQVFTGHSGDVVDLSWSKNNLKFLLSASVDKTVRLWFLRDNQCLRVFPHADLVTSVDFHPSQDLLFVTGCMDRKLRIWALRANTEPAAEVIETAHTPEMITSACFTPDGRMVVAGLCRGLVLFYSYINDGTLRFFTQMDCRNKRGEFRYGRNVTGISFYKKKDIVTVSQPFSAPLLAGPSENDEKRTVDKTTPTATSTSNSVGPNPSASGGTSVLGDTSNPQPSANIAAARAPASVVDCGKTEMLVSINDSRIRLCDLDDFSVTCKAKGAQNTSMQIKASFSEDGKYIISGSETGAVFIWNKVPPAPVGGLIKGTSGVAASTASSATSGAPSSRIKGVKPDRNKSFETFQVARGSGAATTVALFAPASAVTKATQINPCVYVLDYVPDLCSRIIVTATHEGHIYVFSRGLDA